MDQSLPSLSELCRLESSSFDRIGPPTLEFHAEPEPVVVVGDDLSSSSSYLPVPPVLPVPPELPESPEKKDWGESSYMVVGVEALKRACTARGQTLLFFDKEDSHNSQHGK